MRFNSPIIPRGGKSRITAAGITCVFALLLLFSSVAQADGGGGIPKSSPPPPDSTSATISPVGSTAYSITTVPTPSGKSYFQPTSYSRLTSWGFLWSTYVILYWMRQ